MGNQCAFEERSGRRDVSALRDIDVDDLAVLIHSPVVVTPDTGDLDIGLVHEPSIADAVTARPRRIDQKRREALDPSVDGDVINLDPTFGQEFLNVSIRKAVAQVKADRQQDHLWREPKPANADRSNDGETTRRWLIPTASPTE
jgi:hypothetical protein